MGKQKYIILWLLALSNKPFIYNVTVLAPFGKSDLSLLSIDCNFQTANVKKIVKCNYNKGVDDRIRHSILIN